MPEYQLTHAAWLAKQIEIVGPLLLHLLDPEKTYTREEILLMLKERGLDYDNPTYQEIGLALIADGTIEAVP